METEQTIDLRASHRIYLGRIAEAADLNRQILEAYRGLCERDFTRRTHHFGGRYENLYLERQRIPPLARVLEQATACAAKILAMPAGGLRCGFWLNDMGPGQATSRHTHAELDELLSGVYYVEVPPDSGELVVFDRRMRTLVQPEPGMLVFFRPDVPHEVSLNRSGGHRLSVGMNFGPIDAA
jgi:uncharacterized cupin superfamily protein